MKLNAIFLSALLIYSHCLFGMGDELLPTRWYALTGSSYTQAIEAIDTSVNLNFQSYPITDPVALALTPDRTLAYITNRSDNQVAVLELLTGNLQAISVPGGPFSIAISPDGSAVYVGCIDNNTIVTFATQDFSPSITTISDPFFLINAPQAIAVTPDGTKVYAVSRSLNSVVTFSTSDLILSSISGFNLPDAIAITPNGLTAYIANQGSNDVTPLTIADNSLGTPIPVGDDPVGIAITPDGTAAYVTNNNDDTVSKIALPTNVVTALISVGPGGSNYPQAIAITPDGSTAYVTLSEVSTPNNVAVIDLENLEVTYITAFPQYPIFMSITPDQAPTALFSTNSPRLAGTATIFDASSSTSPIGTIASYSWNFGDGTTEIISTPTISHTYASSGDFTVYLQVINSAGTSLAQTFTGQTASNNGGPTAQIFQTVTVLPLPIHSPEDPTGRQRKITFATQTDVVNVIKWKAPSSGSPPVAYRIYRNSGLTELAGVVSSNESLKFEDHNRKKTKTYTYYLVSVDSEGHESSPTMLIMKATS